LLISALRANPPAFNKRTNATWHDVNYDNDYNHDDMMISIKRLKRKIGK